MAVDPDAERLAAVEAALQAAADPAGFVPFDRFMEIALYAPRAGLYMRPEPALGPAGEFYTAAHVHPLFGATVAARILGVHRALGEPAGFRVAEVGPGDGSLAAAILPELAHRSIEYEVVERSLALRDRTRERLASVAEESGVELRFASSVSEEGPFSGVVLANELLDAMPARRLRWDGASFHELGARREGERWLEVEGPVVDSVPPMPAPETLAAGTVVEFSPSAEAWIREVADHLAEGLALVIDYGLGDSELIAGHPRGTLAAVRGHRSLEDPYDRPGSADLSVFVAFDRIRAAARRAGLVELAFRRQSEALGAWGLSERLDAAIRESGGGQAEVRLRLATKNLLFGFENFFALELAAPASATVLGVPT